jgi:uncharacterized membrane protein YfcA
MTFLVGFVVAIAVGLTGVGAGSITAPVLILLFGVTPADAVGTSLVYAAAIKLAVAPVYFWRKQVSLRVLTLLCAGGVPGVLAGVTLIEVLDGKRYQHLLLMLIGATVAIMALFSLYRTVSKHVPTVGRDRPAWLPWIAAGIGAEVGFSSAGTGALGSLVLLHLTSLPPAQVVGTSILFGLILSLIGGGFHLSAGHYNGTILWQLLAGGLAGVFIGANLSAVLPARPLRIALAACLSGLGLQLCWKAFAY